MKFVCSIHKNKPTQLIAMLKNEGYYYLQDIFLIEYKTVKNNFTGFSTYVASVSLK